jgi:hypothetical protein
MVMRNAGWDKIVKVEVETFEDEYGVREFGHVWVITDRGDVYAYATYKGETEEGNAEMLRRRGWTNDRCTYYGRA